jgi:hypothetical protein
MCCAVGWQPLPTGDLAGRGIDLAVAPGQKYSFAFDKVFDPAADQAAVFEEISELVQSALDGHKVGLVGGRGGDEAARRARQVAGPMSW